MDRLNHSLPLAQVITRNMGGTEGLLSVLGEAQGGAIVARTEVRAPREGLNIPAAPPVWLAHFLLAPEAPALPGLRSVAEFVPARYVEEWLVAEGYTVTRLS